MDAFRYLRITFETLVKGYQQSKQFYPGRPLITTKPNFLPSVFDIKNRGGKVGEKTFEWWENLDGWMRILVLEIDVQEYTYFLAYTPGIMMTVGGTGTAYFYWRPAPDLTDEVFHRCRQFIVESAIRLGRRDFCFDAWNTQHASSEDQRNTVAINRVMSPDESGLLATQKAAYSPTSPDELQEVQLQPR